MSDLMVHALDAAELARVHTRHPPQRTDIFLAFCPSFDNVDAAFDDTVYTLRVNQAFATSDMIYEVDYDRDGLGAGVAADFANCLDDMTVFVGTSEGAYDVGVARLRGFTGGSDEDSGTMLLGEMSEVDWEDNLYLTVIDDFNLWPRHVYIDGVGDIFMDRDVAYTDQHQYPDPVPVLGPDAVVYDVDNPINVGNTVDVLFDASDSWALDGGALTYSWDAPGASATVGMGTATPTVTYNAPGRYTVSCAVTRNYGGGHVKVFTGYRRVYIFDVDHSPTVKFELGSDPSGQWDTGGWNFSVRMWDEARLSEVVDRAKVILFANDWFGDDNVSVGPIKSATHGVLRANVIAVGWISGESIVFSNERGWVEFAVQGPQFWFDVMTGFPHGVEDYMYPPLDWFQFEDLTVDKGLWSFLHWRTTATRMMDVYLTGDARQIKEFADPLETLWRQITRASEDTILAHPCCDRYGRLFVEIPVNLLFLGDRAGIPTVTSISRQDWRDEIDIERVIVTESSLLDMSGIGYQDEAADAYFSMAFGHIFGRYGSVHKKEQLALFRVQANNNTLCGLLLDAANNRYPNVDIMLSGNYRVFDICPHQYIKLDVAEGDTERGVVFSDALENNKFIPTAVSFVYDSASGVLMSDITVQGETKGVSAVDGDAPVAPPPLPDPDYPPGPIPPEPTVWDGPIKMMAAWNSRQIGWTADLLRHFVLGVGTAGTGGGGGLDLYDTEVDFNDLEVEAGDSVQNHTDGGMTTVADPHHEDPHYLELAADINLDPGDSYNICGAQWIYACGSIDPDPAGDNEVIIQMAHVRTGDDTVGAWCLTEIVAGGVVAGGNVWYTSNILTGSPSWSLKLTLATVRTAMGVANLEFRGIVAGVADPQFAMVSVVGALNGTGLGVCVTVDAGGAWAYPIAFPIASDYYYTAMYHGMDIDDAGNAVYCLRGGNNGTRGTWVWRAAVPPGAGSFVMGLARVLDFEHWDRHGGIYRSFGGGDTYVQAQGAVDLAWEKSSDNGDTWSGLIAAGYAYVGTPGGFNGWHGSASHVITIGVEVAAPNHFVLLRSDDGGASWAEIGDADGLFTWTPAGWDSTMVSTADTWPPDGDVFVWVGLCPNQVGHSNPRIFYTPDNGAHWCNMMGNWYSNPDFDYDGDADEDWAGATQHVGIAGVNKGRTGNCGTLLLPRIGVNE